MSASVGGGGKSRNGRKKHGPVELDLTPLLDVVSMIIIFLVVGGVFGVADVEVPSGVKLPRSLSHESMESGTRVAIAGNQVLIFLKKENPLPLQGFLDERPENRSKLVAEIKKILPEAVLKDEFSVLNFVADEKTPYSQIFAVVRVFREAGLKQVTFVAKGEGNL